MKMYGAHSQRRLVLRKFHLKICDRPNRRHREVNRPYTLRTANTPWFVTLENAIIGTFAYHAQAESSSEMDSVRPGSEPRTAFRSPYDHGHP